MRCKKRMVRATGTVAAQPESNFWAFPMRCVGWVPLNFQFLHLSFLVGGLGGLWWRWAEVRTQVLSNFSIGGGRGRYQATAGASRIVQQRPGAAGGLLLIVHTSANVTLGTYCPSPQL